ncbi:hypothetical protein [Synechococcus sp. RedBA-s]|nr:hypothetical protein [Synechococcus sp. RedBA-s]MCP9800270.1 hypothetical protein [Synechococcus sp. RedBA-s]
MPGKRLPGNGELNDGGTWPKASVAEPLRDELLQQCRQRLATDSVLSGG